MAMRDAPAFAGRRLRSFCLALALAAAYTSAQAAELTVFATGAGPGEAWNRGWGGSFTITLFDFVHGELEGLSQGSELPDTSLVSLSGKAYLGPTFGRLVPYAGLGLGLYHWGRDEDDDNAQYTLAFAGLKVKLPAGIVLRGEWQWVDIDNDTALPFDHRVMVGAGLRF
jgi:hypothetical protein